MINFKIKIKFTILHLISLFYLIEIKIKMDNDFEQEFKSFYGFFSDEKSIITSSLSINTKLANEMQVKGQNLIEKHRLLSQIYYLTEASRVFTLEELTFPLREFKTLSIASSLRIFQRPNHKDRFSHMIYFLVSNPTYLAQIVYFMMLKVETINVKNNSEENQFRFTKDDIEFFCYFFANFVSIAYPFGKRKAFTDSFSK